MVRGELLVMDDEEGPLALNTGGRTDDGDDDPLFCSEAGVFLTSLEG